MARRALRMNRFVAASAALMAFLAAPAAADPPADAFCVIVIEGVDGFSLVRVKVDEETSLEERAALWPTVDLDGDGTVPPLEQQAFRENATRVWPGGAGLGNKSLTMGTSPLHPDPMEMRRPLHAVTWRQVGHEFHQQDYRLPDTLTTSAELETQEVREYRFDVAPGRGLVELRGGQDVQGLPAQGDASEVARVAIEYVLVRAPEGWLVDRIEGRTYNGTFVLEPAAAAVDVPAFDTKAPWSIRFVHPATLQHNRELASPTGIPAPAMAAAFLAVLGGAWSARRAAWGGPEGPLNLLQIA